MTFKYRYAVGDYCTISMKGDFEVTGFDGENVALRNLKNDEIVTLPASFVDSGVTRYTENGESVEVTAAATVEEPVVGTVKVNGSTYTNVRITRHDSNTRVAHTPYHGECFVSPVFAEDLVTVLYWEPDTW